MALATAVVTYDLGVILLPCLEGTQRLCHESGFPIVLDFRLLADSYLLMDP